MLNSGKIFRAMREKKNILTLVMSEKKILNETKNHKPCKLNGRSLITCHMLIFINGFGFMVFNATFDNISIISWWSGLLVEETRVPGENHRPVASH
jgi:hypothetical protein